MQLYKVRGHTTIDPKVKTKPDHIIGPHSRPVNAANEIIPSYMGVYNPFFAAELKPRGAVEFYRSGYQGALVRQMVCLLDS